MTLILTWFGLLGSSCMLIVLVAAGGSKTPRTRLVFTVDRKGVGDQRCTHGMAQRVGSRVRRLGGRDANPERDLVVGYLCIVGTSAAMIDPLLGIVVAVVGRGFDVVRRARRTRASADQLHEGLAEVVDLFAMALRSGHTVVSAVDQVQRWNDGPVGQAFGWAQQQVRQGRLVSDALEALPARVGPVIRPLAAALISHERYGSPVAEHLAQLAADNRAEQRRRAEAAARRLPVTLLFPLVVCVLPAFLLLTVVPVVAETLTAFDGFASP